MLLTIISITLAPAAPENLEVNSIGSTWIVFSWQQSDMDRDIVGYIILITGGDIERNVTIDSMNVSTNVTGLQSGTEYSLRVVTVAMDGQTSPPSTVLTATTSLLGNVCMLYTVVLDTLCVLFISVAPSSPENIMVVSFGSTWIVVSWEQDPRIDRYIITVSGEDEETSVTVDGSESSVNVTGLLPGTAYRVRMVAVAMDGQISPPSAALDASTTTPGA